MTTPLPNGENSFTTNNSTPNSSVSFSRKQTLCCSVARADLHFLKSPNKKADVIRRFATKYILRISFKKSRNTS